MTIDNFGDVGDFHTKFGLPSNPRRPQHPTRELLEFRLNFILEELQELMEAYGAHFAAEVDFGGNLLDVKVVLPEDAPQTPDHAKAFDSMIDIVYVTLGFAHIEGYPWTEGWDAVQEANMAKIRATSETASARGGTWDVIKPPGWIPPDISGLLYKKGWGIKCPKCGSPDPKKHPAVQFEGEVQPCSDPFHNEENNR